MSALQGINPAGPINIGSIGGNAIVYDLCDLSTRISKMRTIKSIYIVDLWVREFMLASALIP